MTQQPRPRTQITDPTGQAVAANVRRVREQRGLSTYELSRMLGKAGRPIAPSALAKVERGERRVDAGDLTALASALGVSPAALLLPLNDRPGARIGVTGAGDVDAADAWDWAEGKRPLKSSERDEQTGNVEFLVNSVPRNRRILRQHPAGRALAALQQDIEALISRSSYLSEGDTEEVRMVSERAQRSAARLVAEIDYLDAENARAREGRDDG